MTTPNEETPRERSIELELEAPGTPEQVWEAIATGPGITSWFVPAEVEEREGGCLSLDIMGKGMEASGVVTAWDPPRRFVYEEQDPFGPDRPARLATEWLVEARSGGTCLVRLVNSLFASGGRRGGGAALAIVDGSPLPVRRGGLGGPRTHELTAVGQRVVRLSGMASVSGRSSV